MENLNMNKTGYVVGIISVVFYLVCTTWGGLFSSTVLKELHFNLLQLAYPGFSFTAAGYLAGLVDSFIYGWVTGILFAWLCKKTCVNKK